LVFIALSGVAFGTLKKAQIGGASGLFNLLRNIGGSIGIAAANTIATRHLQTHRGELVRSLTGSNLNFHREVTQLTMRMQLHAGPGFASRQAFSLVQADLDQQARLLGYIDDFRYLALICLFCVPLVFLMKNAKSKGAAA
jgi:DHA2 family multidrug resistance protein